MFPDSDPPNILYNTLGPNGEFDGTTGWVVGFAAGSNQTVAMPFSPYSTGTIGDVVLALGHSGGSNTAVSVFLESDNGGVPGSILASFTQSGNITAFPGGLVTFNCSSCPTVDLGTEYWLVAQETDGSSSQAWMWSWNDVQGAFGYNEVGSATGPWRNETYIQSGFRVDGVSTPEPATMIMLGGGILACAAGIRRRIGL